MANKKEVEPKKESTEGGTGNAGSEKSVVDNNRETGLEALKVLGANPKKRFRVVTIAGGAIVFNPDDVAVSSLDPLQSVGECNKLASRFNALIKPPKEKIVKGGTTGSIEG